MAKWDALGFGSEPVPVDVSDLPDQPGASFAPLPQPGDATFRLPDSDALAEAWEHQIDDKGTRHPVLVLSRPRQGETGPDARLDMAGYGKIISRLSGKPREIQGRLASDLHFLVAGAFEHKAPIVGALGLAQAVLLYAGKDFRAYYGWQTNCNAANDIYGDDGQQIPGKKGCGRRYGERAFKTKAGNQTLAIPVVDGKLSERFECVCGASLRAFGNLNNFRPVA